MSAWCHLVNHHRSVRVRGSVTDWLSESVEIFSLVLLGRLSLFIILRKMRDAVSGLLWWRQNCSNTNNSGQSSLEISRANFRRVYVAHRGFSIKVDQSNRHSVTQQSGGSFSHQTLPQDVNIAERGFWTIR